jgi:hypothetical protein
MDGRDQPDTNVVQIRRRGDPSEAERKRLARTIFAEEDDVGTFSRGNLVPPAANRSSSSQDTARAERDPYFENLQRSHGPRRETRAPASTDFETAAYFEQLTNSSPDDMAFLTGAPLAEHPMPRSAQLPAESVRPARGRKRQPPTPIPATTRETRCPDSPAVVTRPTRHLSSASPYRWVAPAGTDC